MTRTTTTPQATTPQPDWNAVGPELLAALRAMVDFYDSDGLEIGPAQQARAVIAKAERSTARGLPEFFRARFGGNWVLARRSPRIVAQYGEDVRCITRTQYRQAELDYLNGVAP